MAKQYLRTKLLLSQEQLAGCIGVSRSLLKLYEAGLRSLPAAAFIKLAKMEVLLAGMQDMKASAVDGQGLSSELKALHPAAEDQIRARIAECDYQLKNLERQQKKMEHAHTQACTWLQVLKAMQEKPLIDNESQKVHLWVSIQQYEVEKKIERCGYAAQLKLETKLELFKAELEIQKSMLKKWKR